MKDLELSLALTPYDRVLPLINGEVKPDGITIVYEGMPGAVPGVFYDQIKFHRYDISEFSLSSFLVEKSKGFPYRALPVFQGRAFHHTNITIRKSSGIRQDHPEDLKGKRYAVMDYQQSAALWQRGILLHEWGVKPEDITWIQTRGEHLSHTGASGTKLPAGVKLQYATEGITHLYLKGEIDCAMGLGGSGDSLIDRKEVDLRDNPDFTYLFSDRKAEGSRYFKKTGMFPINHTTVVREEILKEHPWVAVSLYEAFDKAKKIAMERLKAHPPQLLVMPEYYLQDSIASFGPDPWAYGIKANLPTIDMTQTISVEQGLTPRKQPLEEIFAEQILILEERL